MLCAEESRRKAWLERSMGKIDDKENVVLKTYDKDSPDYFKLKTGKRHPDWKQAVQIAGAIHIDEIRTLLEMHYDDVHMSKWRTKSGKAPKRQGDYKLFQAVVQTHRKSLCQRLQ